MTCDNAKLSTAVEITRNKDTLALYNQDQREAVELSRLTENGAERARQSKVSSSDDIQIPVKRSPEVACEIRV